MDRTQHTWETSLSIKNQQDGNGIPANQGYLQQTCSVLYCQADTTAVIWPEALYTVVTLHWYESSNGKMRGQKEWSARSLLNYFLNKKTTGAWFTEAEMWSL